MPSALPSQLTKEDLLNENSAQLQTSGMTFYIKYIGSIPIGISMNTISKNEQNNISRVCILKLLHAANRIRSTFELNTYSEFFTNEMPEIFNNYIDLNITSTAITIIQNMKLQKFLMRDISLVVPGTQELSKYFCLFANMKRNQGTATRRCFVFLAESEMKVIWKTILMAFRVLEQKLGLPSDCKQAEGNEAKPIPKARSTLSRDKTPTPPSISTTPSTSNFNSTTLCDDSVSQLNTSIGDVNINETQTKKRAPSRSSSRSPLSSASSSKSIIYSASGDGFEDVNSLQIRVERASPNLHAPPPLPPRSRNNSAILTTPTDSPHRNDLIRRSVPITRQNSRRSKSNETSSIDRSQSVAVNITQQQFDEITRNLNHEPWFHGKLSRAAAEAYIIDNGQFLVRQSPNINGQIVLSGMQDTIVKHICLVDQEGFLRTSEGEFGTVSQLIKYYYQNRCPVRSDSSELTLIEPVYRRSIRRVR